MQILAKTRKCRNAEWGSIFLTWVSTVPTAQIQATSAHHKISITSPQINKVILQYIYIYIYIVKNDTRTYQYQVHPAMFWRCLVVQLVPEIQSTWVPLSLTDFISRAGKWFSLRGTHADLSSWNPNQMETRVHLSSFWNLQVFPHHSTPGYPKAEGEGPGSTTCPGYLQNAAMSTPWLKFRPCFPPSFVRQMPGYNTHRRGTARTLLT